jgi:hypothetical protein
MSIVVYSAVQEEGHFHQISSTFNSLSDFEVKMKAWALGEAPFPFGSSLETMGSDSQVLFYDPDLQDNMLEDAPTGFATSASTLKSMSYKVDDEPSNHGFEMIARTEDNVNSIFKYRRSGRRQSSRISSRNDVSAQRVTGVRNSRFANNSKHIEQVKHFILDNEEKITQILISDIESHVKIIDNKGLTYVLESYDDIAEYYSKLNCILFSLELYYSTSKLILFINAHFNIKYTAGNARNQETYKEFEYVSMPANIRKSFTPGIPSSLIYNIIKKTSVPNYIDAISIDMFSRIAYYLDICVVFFNDNVIAKNIDTHGSRINKMIQTTNSKIKVTEVDSTNIYYKPLIYYNFHPMRKDKRRANRRFELMMFCVSDMWEETMHAEAILDFYTVHAFMQGTNNICKPKIEYRGTEVYTNSSESYGLEYDFIGTPTQVSPSVRDYRKIFMIPMSKTYQITTAEDLSNYLTDLKLRIKQYENASTNVSDEEAVNLYNLLCDNICTNINISYKLFSDKATSTIILIEPWIKDGIINMLSLFSFMFFIFNVDENKHSLGISNFIFENANVGLTPNELRRMLILDNKRNNTYIQDIFNLKCFSFYYNMPSHIRGMTKYRLSLNFRVGCKDDGKLIDTVLNNELFTINKEIEIQQDILIEYNNKRIEDYGDDESKQYMINLLLAANDKISSKNGIVQYYKSTGGIFYDTFNSQRNKKSDSTWGKDYGHKYLSTFGETLSIPFEILQSFTPSLLEPIASISWNTTDWNMHTMPKLCCIDIKKAYTNILHGGYKRVWNNDIYKQLPQIGGMFNCGIYEVNISKQNICSYFIDYGGVIIKGNEIDWIGLTTICPEYFNHTNTWWIQNNRKLTIVDSYVLINACARVCVMLGKTSINDKMLVYTNIQKCLNIKYGLFDFNTENRNAFHCIAKKYYTYSPSLLDNLAIRFGYIIESSMKNRYVIHESNAFGVYSQNPLGFNCKPVKFSGYKSNLSSYEIQSINRFHTLQSRFADINYKIFDSYIGDKDECVDELKKQVNTFIGKLKYACTGGIRHSQIADVKKGGIKNGEHSVLTDKIKRRRLNDSEINVHDVNHAANTIYWKAAIDGPEEVIKDSGIIVSTSMSILISRNSLSPLRRYIINTCRVLMDHLNSMCKVFRTATDSLLVQPEDVDMIQKEIKRLCGKRHLISFSQIPIHGHMGAESTVEEVDTTIPESGRTIYDSNGALKSIMYLEPKYRSIFRANSYFGHSNVQTPIMDEMENKLLEDCFTKTIVYKDSELLLKFYNEKGSKYGSFDCGIKLHAMLMSINEEPDVKSFYKDFVVYTSKFIYNLNGALLVGDPGCGKTYRSKEICNLSAFDNKLPVVTAAMHSIVNLYGNHVFPNGEKLDSMTIYKFCKCMRSPEKYARSPHELLESGGYDNKCLSSKYSLMICEEIETFPKVFEEYLKVMKESFGMKFYLVGDPLQSAPMMNRGFDLDGSVSNYLIGGNKYIFDLQFRNTDIEYMKCLDKAAKGDLNVYLEPQISNYLEDQSACITLFKQLRQTAIDIINGNKTRIYACSNYNFQMCIFTTVLQLMLTIDEVFVYDAHILIYTGHNIKDNNYAEFDYKDEIHRDYKPKGVKKLMYNSKYMRDHNGPPGAKSLIGTPLIMKDNIRFRIMDRFRPIVKREVGYGYPESYYLSKIDIITFRRRGDPIMIKDVNEGEHFNVDTYVFESEIGETVILTSFEVSMYLVYEFAILRDFVLGTTLESLTIVQPYYRNFNNNDAYTSIKSLLVKHTIELGKDSIQTTIGRLMRVCVTRVTDSSKTFVMDIDVSSKTFWKKCLWSGKGSFLMTTHSSISTFDEFITISDKMFRVVEYGKRDWIKCDTNPVNTGYIQSVELPMSRRDIPIDDNGAFDAECIKSMSFPLYLA